MPPTPPADADLGEQCAICLEPLDVDEGTVPLACSHRFHAFCVIPWLQQGNRSCPTCRNKPPRQLRADSESDAESHGGASDFDLDEDHDAAAHQALHDGWDITWGTYLARLDSSEEARSRAMARGKALATRKPKGSTKQQQRAAKKLVRITQMWKAKASQRSKTCDVLDKAVHTSERQLQRQERRIWCEYDTERRRIERVFNAKFVAARAPLRGLEKQRLSSRKAEELAKRKVRRAESDLAKIAGWTPPADPPTVPADLLACVLPPFHRFAHLHEQSPKRRPPARTRESSTTGCRSEAIADADAPLCEGPA